MLHLIHKEVIQTDKTFCLVIIKIVRLFVIKGTKIQLYWMGMVVVVGGVGGGISVAKFH